MTEYKEARVTTLRDGVATLYDLTKDSFARFASRQAMGQRVFKGWKVPGKVKHFGDVEWLSYGEVGEKAAKFGAALRKEGLDISLRNACFVETPGTLSAGELEMLGFRDESAITLFVQRV